MTRSATLESSESLLTRINLNKNWDNFQETPSSINKKAKAPRSPCQNKPNSLLKPSSRKQTDASTSNKMLTTTLNPPTNPFSLPKAIITSSNSMRYRPQWLPSKNSKITWELKSTDLPGIAPLDQLLFMGFGKISIWRRVAINRSFCRGKNHPKGSRSRWSNLFEFYLFLY